MQDYAQPEPRLELVWAKSDAAGSPHSLPGHLMDTVAVAELIWDGFMAPAFRAKVHACANGRGRDLFRLMCGWHDVGKASPPFESKDLKLAAGLERELGPGSLGGLSALDKEWHHTHAGRAILEDYLPDGSVWSWVPVLIEGHHGVFATFPAGVSFDARGGDAWIALQRRLCAWVEDQVGLHLADLEGTPPSRATQLALAGFVVMADWIASCDQLPGLGTAAADLSHARRRARKAWDAFALRGGWALTGEAVPFIDRFGFEPRPLQQAVIDAAEAMERPGLMLVEAPMGEGKTEAALAAVEIMARRFGCDGFVFAMPTQGTTDAMYTRCEEWAHRVDPTFPLALVHGKAALNDDWSKRLDDAKTLPDVVGIWDDYFGMADPYSSAEDASPRATAPLLRASGIPSSWLLLRHRALLSPGVVMTVDHLLYAGTNTKFVMLRHAGLSGKVVVIDEVHSYDVFMESFLDTVLRWLGEAGVPVILMSATLPPEQRTRLLDAYNGPAPKQPRPWAGAVVTPPPPWVPSSYPVVACRERGGKVTHDDSMAAAEEGKHGALTLLRESLADDFDDKVMPAVFAVRYVWRAGPAFLGAFVIAFTSIGLLNEALSRLVSWLFRRQSSNFWLQALPFTGLIDKVISLGLQVALLVVAFNMASKIATERTERAPARVTPSRTIGAVAITIAVIAVVLAGDLTKNSPVVSTYRGAPGAPVAVLGMTVTADDLRLGTALEDPAVTTSKTNDRFVVVKVSIVCHSDCAQLRPQLESNGHTYTTWNDGTSNLNSPLGFRITGDVVFEVLTADLSDDVVITFTPSQTVTTIPQVASFTFPLPSGAVAAAQDVTVNAATAMTTEVAS